MQDEDEEAQALDAWIEAQEAFVYAFLCDELDVQPDKGERDYRDRGIKGVALALEGVGL